MKTETIDRWMGKVDQRLANIEKLFNDLKEDMKDRYVTREEFVVLKGKVENNVKVRNLVLALVITAIVGGLLTLLGFVIK